MAALCGCTHMRHDFISHDQVLSNYSGWEFQADKWLSDVYSSAVNVAAGSYKSYFEISPEEEDEEACTTYNSIRAQGAEEEVLDAESMREPDVSPFLRRNNLALGARSSGQEVQSSAITGSAICNASTGDIIGNTLSPAPHSTDDFL